MRRTTKSGSKAIQEPERVAMRLLPDHLIASGQPVVTVDRISEVVGLSRRSLHSGLQRLREAGRLCSPARGLYVAVPAEYRSWGVVPADWFIDAMMRHLDRRYYVALLTAAQMHGAAGQAPQVFQVMVDRQLADRDLGRVRLRFHVNSLLAEPDVDLPLQERTTHTGTLRVSGPELTALDLVAHPGLSGGIHNVASVLNELGLDARRLAVLATHYPRVAARRLGWILDQHPDAPDLEPLRRVAEPSEGEALPLDPQGQPAGPRDRRWNLIVNTDIEPDL